MDARQALLELCHRIDGHDWDGLPPLLAGDFTCRYEHTGEMFDRDGWVRLNREYPGFERLTVEELLGDGERAAARCHVTARSADGVARYAVAMFAEVADGVITGLTEVWTDVDQAVPQR